MVKFEPLASSSSGNAYRLSCPSALPLLIDCGISYTAISVALDFSVSQLAGCLISHAHGDHCKAALELMKAGVDCFATPETWRQIEEKWKKKVGHRAHPVSTGALQRIGLWHFTSFSVVHDCEGTVGFVIDSPEGDRGLYLTDSMYSPFTFSELTHIWVECNHSDEIRRDRTLSGQMDRHRASRTAKSHMSLERLQAMLRANDLSQVEEIWLLHLSDENSDEAAFRDAIVKEFGKPTYVAAKRAMA